MAGETDFRYSDLLPVGPDETSYRLVTTDGVSTLDAAGRVFLVVSPEAMERLTSAAIREIAQQDSITAIVLGKKSEGVLTGADDGKAISRGVFDAYGAVPHRPAQLAPMTMWEEHSTGTNLPAQIELYAVEDPVSASGVRRPEYTFLFVAKSGRSANKSALYQETKAVLNPTRLLQFLEEKLRSLATEADPAYHLAVVIGGTSAEFALKTATYASVHHLDTLPTQGTMAAHGFRDLELEEDVFELTQSFVAGPQHGGTSVCLDVRVIRLPRHAGSCPIAVAVASSVDRHVRGKITTDGVFLAQPGP